MLIGQINENEKLLAWQETLLVLDNWTAPSLALYKGFACIFACKYFSAYFSGCMIMLLDMGTF